MDPLVDLVVHNAIPVLCRGSLFVFLLCLDCLLDTSEPLGTFIVHRYKLIRWDNQRQQELSSNPRPTT